MTRWRASSDRRNTDEGWDRLLEDNLERLARLAPQHLPLARAALARHHLRRVRRAIREERREDAERGIARALELDPGVRWRVMALRMATLFR